MPKFGGYQERVASDYLGLSEIFTPSDGYDLLDDDFEFYEDGEDGFDEYYDDEIENDDSEYLADYVPDMIDDSAELAEVLRDILHENYQHTGPEQMEDALFDMLEQMTPAEGINLMGALQQISQVGGKAIKDPMFRKIAGTALPVAGGTLGTMIGGPVGTALGGKLGQAAGKAISGGEKPSTPTTSATTPPTSPPTQTTTATTSSPTVQASPQNGSTAAAQLLQLTQNPGVLKSLMSLALGSHGRSSIPVVKDGSSVPVGAFMNMLGQLAVKAATDADQLYGESDEKYGYLLDSQGQFAVDPAIPEGRAQALYNALLTAENRLIVGEGLSPQPWSIYLPFERDTKFLVEYETVLRDFDIGKGNILERTSDLLKAKIHINRWDRFGVPETYAMLMIKYVQDGPGNKAVIVINDRQYTDDNVTIHSRQDTREILMSINFLGQKVDRISIIRTSVNKANLKFITGGDQHVLVLTKEGS
jgi:hypothetical protein